MLIDSHCHLDYLAREGVLAGALERAREAGVGRMVTIGTRPSRFSEIVEIVEAEPDVYCTLGVHPHEAGKEGVAEPEPLIALAGHSKIVGIGESGLDYYYDNSPREDQQRSFRAHIAAARRLDLPLVVHTRDAEEDTVAILKEGAEEGEGAPLRFVLHCFSGTAWLAERGLELGGYISVSGILTFNRAQELRDVVEQVPLERLLVETDAPYLAPVPKRGKPNEPAFVRHTAQRLAELKGLGMAEIEAATSENFFRLFNRVPAPVEA